MFKRAFVVASLALASISAHADLQTLGSPLWPPTPSTGLENVQFNVDGNQTPLDGASVALGAHEYTTSPYLPNDGVSTFYAPAGLTTPTRAMWSFDFAFTTGECENCSVILTITDANNPLNSTALDLTEIYGNTNMDSWNLEMTFLQSDFSFDAFSPSSTDFDLKVVTNADGEDRRTLADTSITVDVPEPASIALVGLALGAVGLSRRRRKN